DSRATDFIRPLLGKRPRIAVQPPSTMPSLLTIRSYRAFVRTSTLALELEQPRLRSLCGHRKTGPCPPRAPPVHVTGWMNPAAARSARSLAISSTAARRPFALLAGVVSPFGLTEECSPVGCLEPHWRRRDAAAQ